MESIALFSNKKQRVIFYGGLLIVFCFNLLFLYYQFKDFKKNEIFQTDAIVLNIYKKDSYNVVKLQSDDKIYFTSISKDIKIDKLDGVNILLDTRKIDFLSYLKGFYLKNIEIFIYKQKDSVKKDIYNYIKSQHKNSSISSIYEALFLSISVDKDLRQLFSNYGISHLIAISGFHLGLILSVIYFIVINAYKPIHQKYFPYRNKKSDVLVFSSIILYWYLLLIDIPPSFLRAFIMFVFGFILLRDNIKILNFETLFIVSSIIMAFFPKLIFSLSLWLSIAGVFYIFIFIKYSQKLNKYIRFVLFNFWIFFAMFPIVHYFFYNFAYEQLLSPIISMLFIIFYPISFLIHIIGIGDIFDNLLSLCINYNFNIVEIKTQLWFLIIYLLVSFGSIFSKIFFVTLNILIFCFSMYKIYYSVIVN